MYESASLYLDSEGVYVVTLLYDRNRLSSSGSRAYDNSTYNNYNRRDGVIVSFAGCRRDQIDDTQTAAEYREGHTSPHKES